MMGLSKAHNRPFAVALVVSAVFHLSMVSVFSIVIWFPRRDIEYFSVQLVRQAASASVRTRRDDIPRDVLRVPDFDRAFEFAQTDAPDPEAETGWLRSLPPVQLPRLEFAGLELLRTREETLRVRSRYDEILPRPRQDSWAWFSQELRGIGGLVNRLTSIWPDEEERPKRVSNPAPGFTAYIEWMSEPKDRELLFSPSVRALWNVDPRQLDLPVAVAFRVNAQGKVVEVQIPIEDEMTRGIASALFKYRFEPLAVEETKDQRGTFLVTEAREDQ